ncbi:MAG: family 43 glycosylhydrolase, partial [Stackebrandtia sp.]
YDPSPDGGPKRYLNDHCTIRAADGAWHLFSIIGDTAPPGQVPDSAVEDNIAHATAPDLNGPWTTQPHALTTDPNYHGEDHLWAPHVIEHDGVYYMFYSAGGAGGEGWAVNLATSTDLSDWTRSQDGPLFRHGSAARDPMVLRVGDEWVMYYTEVDDARHHIVAARTSPNLYDWSEPRAVYTDAITDENVSVTESPFVVERDGWWYLFIGTRNGYVGADVFASQDPFAFRLEGYAGHVPAHCAEVVHDGENWWVTAAGWFQDGLHLGALEWRDAPPLWHSPANPAVALDVAGEVRLFALAADRSTLVTRSVESGWEEFGSGFATVPTIGVNADGRLTVFALRPDATAAVRSQQSDGSWQDWEDFGGPLDAAPAAAQDVDGRLELFALGPAGQNLLHRRQLEPNGAEWSDWEEFGGAAGAPPTVAANADGRLEVFALGPGGANVAHRWQTAPGGGWADWDGAFGAPAGAAPTVARGAGGLLQVMVIAPMGLALFNRPQSAPSGDWQEWLKWSDWIDAGAATMTPTADGRLEAFFMPPGGDVIYHRFQNADASWTEQREFGTGPVTATPSACRDADGRVWVFTVAPDGTIHTRVQTASHDDWEDWQRLDGDPVAPVPAGSAT